MAKAQCITCKCGKTFAACVEPYCYTEKEWQKDLRKYVLEGCTVDMREAEAFVFEKCICKSEKQKEDPNQKSLFDETV